METPIKQEVIESEDHCLPTICDVYSIKREDLTNDDARNPGNSEDLCQTNNTGASLALVETCSYDEIKIEEFDIDKALLERERVLSVVLVRCDQVSSSIDTLPYDGCSMG